MTPEQQKEADLLDCALSDAEQLVEDGWENSSDEPEIHNRAGETRKISISVWKFMQAISCGIGMRAKWERAGELQR